MKVKSKAKAKAKSKTSSAVERCRMRMGNYSRAYRNRLRREARRILDETKNSSDT